MLGDEDVEVINVAHTEKKILETLKELKGSKTMIIISHKDEPLKICDRIIDL